MTGYAPEKAGGRVELGAQVLYAPLLGWVPNVAGEEDDAEAAVGFQFLLKVPYAAVALIQYLHRKVWCQLA